jgi:hypothetical protein
MMDALILWLTVGFVMGLAVECLVIGKLLIVAANENRLPLDADSTP